MKLLRNLVTVEDLQKRHRELLKQYHPDNENGSVEITQEINQEYDWLFAVLTGRKESEGSAYSCLANGEFKRVLNEIVCYNMTIEIIGSWIWCFDCYPYKEKLKELGFIWCRKKKAWIWHVEPYDKRKRKGMPLNDIRVKYGSERVKSYDCRYKRTFGKA